MTTEDDFIEAILAAPRDDTLRLVFADWLDERAEPRDGERAEFIRLSIEHPEAVFWPPGRAPAGASITPGTLRAWTLSQDNWEVWTAQLKVRLAGSPFLRWIGKDACRWAYRRGFIALFAGTQQVILDAWDDLFRLGPLEEVEVNRLWHFGTVSSLRLILDRPSIRVLRLNAAEFRDDCVDQLKRVADWLRRFDEVVLFAANPSPSAVEAFGSWLAAEPALKHVRCTALRFQ